MKRSAYPLGVLFLLSVLTARGTDDLLVYSDRFNNGWGDSWSWMPRHATNNPVYTGSNSMACTPGGTYQAWWLKANTSIDTRIYSSVSFWLNGGPSGHTVSVSGELDGSGLPGVSVSAPANTWQHFTISLSSLGVDNKLNLTGFQIGNGSSTQPFYIDDWRLVAAPAPTVVHVNVHSTQTVRTVNGKVFGINQVGWDGGVDTAASVTLLNDMGNPCLRWPGGSWGDGYHWTNEAWSAGATSPRNWGSFSTNFVRLATNIHAQAFIIVNYGTSDASEAAWGVRMFNVTNHCNFKYWEVGNEVGGSWEWDWNTNAPWKAHDPWTYAMRFTNYYAQMKAADPTIRIGAVVDIYEDGTVNNYDHPVVNPRTGVTHYGWTPVMLTYMRSNNCIPDFVIVHNYGPTAGDIQDLLWARRWASDAVNLRQMLTDYLGDQGTNVTMEITENGTGGDKQCVNLPGGLFYADSIGQIMQTEFDSRVWWDFRNGSSSLGDPDPAFYGWRTNSDGTYLVDGGIVYGSGGVGGVGNAYPTYYVARLMPYFAADGDTVVSATSDYPLLATYAVKRTNGTLTLLVINKSSSSNLTAAINLADYLPYTNATVHSYGIPQDDAARTGIGSPDIAQSSLSGVQSSFTNTFAPFSVSVIIMSPGDQPPLTPANLTATGSNAAVALTWDASAGASSFIIKRSTTSGGGYTDVATDVTATSYLDTGLVNGTTYFYVVAATNSYGVSLDSAEASAQPSEMRAYYAFEGNALDTSGNSFNGTANAVTYVAGKVGAQAAQFNGSSSCVTIPRSITDDFTVAMWVKTTDTAGGAGAQWWSGKGLVDGEVGGGGADWGTAIVNGKFVLGVGSVSGDTTIASSVNISDGTWHHVAATRNNTSGAIAVYVDGILRGNGTGPTGSRTFPPGLRIGSLQTANNYLNGTLDDVRLYNRILTVGEIAALIGTPPAPPNGLAAIAGDGSAALSWSGSATASNYFIRRSTTGGSGYITIATNASLTFTNTGLNNGTLYYYVVRAANASGESADSGEVSARPSSFAPTQLSFVAVGNQLQLNWPADHTGWQLQSQTNSLEIGLSTNWSNVSSSAQTNLVTVPLDAANGAVFFRLVSP